MRERENGQETARPCAGAIECQFEEIISHRLSSFLSISLRFPSAAAPFHRHLSSPSPPLASSLSILYIYIYTSLYAVGSYKER